MAEWAMIVVETNANMQFKMEALQQKLEDRSDDDSSESDSRDHEELGVFDSEFWPT